MGYTRTMRYARYESGQKYTDESEAQRASEASSAERSSADSRAAEPRDDGETASDGTERDPQRWADRDEREAALVYEVWRRRAENDERYRELKVAHRERTDADG